MIWHKNTEQTMLDLYNHAPQKHEKMESFLIENGIKMLAEGCFFLEKMPVSNGVCCTKNGRWMLWWWEKKWWQVSQKNSAVTICKLDYWVYISLIYNILWNQWKFRAYIVEIKMMTVFRKMMTQSVKIVKLKEVK